jgi:hypothetical protein
MTTITAWEVTESNGDGVGSRRIALFYDKADADNYALRNRGWRQVHKVEFQIFSSVEEADAAIREKVRAQALQKLTQEERVALGV